jgi:glutaminyl-peptide cyclotransferase
MVRSLCLAAMLTALTLTAYADDDKDIAAAWNGARAMSDIRAQLSFGERSLDTAGHERTIVFIEGELAKTKAAEVKGQQWIDSGKDESGNFGWGSGPRSPSHALVNIVARFYPDNPKRVLLGTHYDSIARAYRDKNHPDGVMPGANNSASGVALLLETARALSHLPPPPVGVDIVFFDGEEGPLSLGGGDPHWHALGSPYFAQHLDEFYPDDKPESAVLFDMVCYKNMELKQEPTSVAAAKEEMDKFWRLGADVAPAVFKPEPYNFEIEDDHDALIKAQIPSFLVIGFDYQPYFNTMQDTLDKCSTASLDAVGHTALRYIYEQ